jgi:hypothetical protein
MRDLAFAGMTSAREQCRPGWERVGRMETVLELSLQTTSRPPSIFNRPISSLRSEPVITVGPLSLHIYDEVQIPPQVSLPAPLS